MKKWFLYISFVFVFAISLLYFNTLSSADTMDDFYISAKKISGGSPSWTPQEFLNKIQEICSHIGDKPINRDNKILNPYIYEHYNLVVYGLPHGDFFTRKNGHTFKDGIQGEYKYLGYSYEGFEITNDSWHNSNWSGVGKFKTYKEVNYIDIPGAEASWNKLLPEQVEYVLNTPFNDDDYVVPGKTPYTLLDIFDNNFELIKRKVLVQVPPGIKNTTSLKLIY